ncbi:hypothetical protein ABJI51_18025 [Amycolatopsis sp. NEAU-NG30]|uniref:NACHT domain-containing protein n=1 Tax=Amycolatopsis melonis TaxID=3156488 RepID=A0ABV0LFB2_9PSEU
MHIGDVSLVTGAPVRTAYMAQVRRIAPAELRGRDEELAELDAFCTAPETAGTYRWVRAAAWTGKSALLSSFVLAPPPGVRVVSFFVTARLSSQNDRVAFTDNVLEQLLTILDQEPPRLLGESTRESHLLRLLAQAAEACRERGEHLVLVVDGLDEDRGVTTDPDGHSIAGLLPAEPPAGLRVLVAGRPNPPVPGDVPSGHPLRDPTIVRTLAASPHAIAIRHEMERDLKRLLGGTVAEQDLLGLLTAAGGGLTAADLAELTGWSLFEVDDHLRTVAGRSFADRSAHYAPTTGPRVYLLGHEELQVAARDVLGLTRLAGYRDRLHTWADEHRRRGWPTSTSEYLLRGYHNLLREQADLPRLVALGTDPARQDRLLDISGGDTAALTEIATTMDLVAAADEPDLETLVRLAVHRDGLRDRNRAVPTELPAGWTLVGRHSRATNLALSMADKDDRGEALLAIAAAAAEIGEQDHTTDALAAAESIACAAPDDFLLSEVAEAVGKLGDLPRAARLARAVGEPDWRSDALVALAEWAGIDEGRTLIGEAMEHARTVRGPQARSRALIACALAANKLGDASDALIDEAGEAARLVSDPRWRGPALVDLATAAARAGARDRVESLVSEAVAAIELVADPRRRNQALVQISDRATRLCGHERALRIVNAISEQDERDRAVEEITAAVAEVDHDLAGKLLPSITNPKSRERAASRIAQAIASTAAKAGNHHRAEELTGGLAAAVRDRALVRFTRAAAEAGNHQRAEQLAKMVAEPASRSSALTDAGSACARAGDTERASHLLADAERCARSVIWPGIRATTLAELARAHASHPGPEGPSADLVTGLLERAVALTDDLDADERVFLMVTVLKTAVSAELSAPVEVAVERALRTIESVADEGERDDLRGWVASGLLTAGDHDRAEAIVRSMTDPGELIDGLLNLARAAATVGQRDRAQGLLDEAGRHVDSTGHRRVFAAAQIALAAIDCDERRLAEQLLTYAEDVADAVLDTDEREAALAGVATGHARIGNLATAEKLVGTFSNPGICATALAQLAKSGPANQASRLLDAGERIVEAAPDTEPWVSSTRADLAEAAQAVGDADRADRQVRAISKADSREDAIDRIVRAALVRPCVERAEAVARISTDAENRALYLLRLQPYLPQERKVTIVAEAILAVEWAQAVNQLLSARPELVWTIAQEVDIVWNRS